MTLRALTDTLLAVLLAPPCGVCGRLLEHPLSGAVCDRCWDAVEPQAVSYSLRGIAQARAIGRYEATLRGLIHALKYDRRRSIAPRLARLMARHAHDVLGGANAVVPVPLHRRRQRQRGFNQADDLARGLGLPVARVLKRVRATRPQVDLPAAERRDNVREAFALARGHGWRHMAGPILAAAGRDRFTDRLLRGSVVVLVDDVATTGATLEACARVLRAAGAREVRAITAARVETAGRTSPRA
jgi:ComF family protein